MKHLKSENAKSFASTLALSVLLAFVTATGIHAQGAAAHKLQALEKGAAFLGVQKNALSIVKFSSQCATIPFCVLNDSASNSFVIVSECESLPDILGYSDCGLFDINNVPPQLKALLEEYERLSQHIARFSRQRKISARKSQLLKESSKTLTTASYNQKEPYNKYCPTDCYTGCVATALSIVMKHYEWPSQGRGSHSYEWDGQTLGFDFTTVFDWDNMLNSYEEDEYSTEQGDAVALLSYACGVAVNMEYGTSASSASSREAQRALVKYFKYSPECVLLDRQRSNCSDEEWLAVIKEEIDGDRPVIYRGSSSDKKNNHMFVIDGYSDNYVHVNWGWGGSYNGFFLLSAMTPGDDGSDYSCDNWMIINIAPDYEETPFCPLQSWRNYASQGIASDVAEIEEGVSFNVTTGYITNRDDADLVDFQLGVALINSNSDIRTIVKKVNVDTLKSNWYFSPITFKKCKSSVSSEDGDSLALVWKYANEEIWHRIPGDGVAKTAIAVKGVDTGIENVADNAPFSAELSVYQLSGKLVARIPRNKYSSLLSVLVPGVYIVKDGEKTKKVFK